MKTNNLILIACADSSWGIGKNGCLLFSLKKDMEFFRSLTMGNVVIMGRRTFDSLPGKKPLRGRINMVFSRRAVDAANIVSVSSVDGLFSALGRYPGKKAFVIGGSEIYRLLLPYCSRAYITRVDADGGAEVFMPDLDEAPGWLLTEKSDIVTENGVPFRFCVYDRQ